jgi:NIPSNAP
MIQRRTTVVLCSLLVFAAIFAIGRVARSLQPRPETERKQRVFEIRTYTTEKDKLPNLLARFRDHTTKLFEKHGMTNIGYWVPSDGERSNNTLIYVLAHESRAAADKSWQAFRTDPDWIKARDASEASGKIVSKVESIYANPTDFSAIK